MANREEIARLARQELLNFINPVRMLSIQANEQTGLISGRFASGPLVFDYRFEPDDTVVYKPLSGTRKEAAAAGEADRDDSLLAAAAPGAGISPAVRLARLSRILR